MTSIRKKAAFTLIELLVVVSIILIATSILFVGSSGGSDGIKLSSSQRVLSSFIQGVRGQALLKNSRTRLIIYSENNTDGDPEKLLRYIGSIRETITLDSDGNEEIRWEATRQGVYLSEGIYFDPSQSATQSTNLAALPTMNIEYPRQSPQLEGSGPEYYFYEYNSNGTISSDDINFLNSWLVLRAGTLKPDSSGNLTVDLTEDAKENIKAALIYRRVGSTTLVTDPTEI